MTKKKEQASTITIPPPNLQEATFRIVGTAPYMQHRFWGKGNLMLKHQQGSAGKNKKKKDPRDFEVEFQAACYRLDENTYGIPAHSFRAAMISACRLVGFAMTKAKLSIFCLADGIDVNDGVPLVRILGGEPEMSTMATRNATGVVDIRARPMWREWQADVRLQWDADQFTAEDVTNLLARVGVQVGLGEGRHDSKKSTGMGFGLFRVDGLMQHRQEA